MASIDKRPNGTWRVRWRETPGGPQKTKAFGREKDAKAFRNKVARELDTGLYVDPQAGRVSFTDYADQWLRGHHRRPATVVAARNALLHAKAVFGDKPIAAVRRSDVQGMVDRMRTNGSAPRTIALAVQHTGSVFRSALLDDLIPKSPVVGLRVPRPEGEMVIPTTDQVLAILDAAPKWFRPGIILGAGLGLRQGEAAGVTWDRVRFLPERTVAIDRQWARGGGFAPTKTAAGNRVIPASGWVLTNLAPYSPGPDAKGPVVTLPGKTAHVSSTAWGTTWVKACDDAGVEGVKFHDLRHFFASALISGGASVKQVQTALGHASAAVTLDTYTKLWPTDADTTRAAFDRIWATEPGCTDEVTG